MKTKDTMLIAAMLLVMLVLVGCSSSAAKGLTGEWQVSTSITDEDADISNLQRLMRIDMKLLFKEGTNIEFIENSRIEFKELRMVVEYKIEGNELYLLSPQTGQWSPQPINIDSGKSNIKLSIPGLDLELTKIK